MKSKKKKQNKKLTDGITKEKRQVFVEPDRVKIGDIELQSMVYSASQLLTLVDLALKKKSIRDYLEGYRNKKILNGSSYLG